MDKIYNPIDIEQSLYKNWEKQGYFKPKNDINQKNFCIMLPPPNVTGSLHMGHAFQQTIMDILIRHQRMLGRNTLWQAGTDHAGIAVQMIVERKISSEEEKKTRQDYSRDAFLEKIWQWKEESRKIIKKQMQRLGNSIDWERERFTMDTGFSNAVREIFIRLYKENLIYRRKRLVNWDPKLRTAISDLEVEIRAIKGSIFHIRYPLADGAKTSDGKDYLVVATTRPETLFGDTGVAVNPQDVRYQNLIGKSVILPLVNRRIPILGDEYADMKKGTGCVKLTPAHDFNDYEVGLRHKLPMINIFTFDGNIRENIQVYDTHGKESNIYSSTLPKAFWKMERFVARNEVIETLDKLHLLESIKDHDLTISYGDRSGAEIEPMLTNQWYVHTAPLAKVAIEAVKNGDIQFVPKQYENMYFSWMRDIKDWCISRQLWWGHRIPAWYDKLGNIYVGHNEAEIRTINKIAKTDTLHQDEDVLDTWFSSSIWTFSSLGWPDNTKDLQTFHPTNVLVSGFDIIFFWIARMIMLTMHFIKNKNGSPQIPFKTVYITGLIRDEEGQKMSKSRGNIIDPIDIVDGITLNALLKKRTENMMQTKRIEKIYECTKKQFPNGIRPAGTDALRFTLAALASTGRDINWDMNRLEGYRKFCNKLWNASRFVLMNTEEKDCGQNGGKIVLSVIDRWILSKFNNIVKSYQEALSNYRFDIAANILYEFTWNQFCDWYLEFAKPVIRNGSEVELRGTRYTLITVLEALLRLAHPIIPFITETIWQHIKKLKNIKDNTIMLQPFPSYDATKTDNVVLSDIEWIKQMIIAIRNIRSEMHIPKSKSLLLLLRTDNDIVKRRINEYRIFLLTMARLSDIKFLQHTEKIPFSFIKVIEHAELLIPMINLSDKKAELDRIVRELDRIEVKIKTIQFRLKNNFFVTRAPKEIVKREYDRQNQLNQNKAKLIAQYTKLSSRIEEDR